MKNLKKLWFYIKPYKGLAFLNVLFNIIQVVFSLSALALVIPFLSILFEQQELVLQEPEPGLSASSAIDYFNYYLSTVIVEQGKKAALLTVSFTVIAVILLKNLFIYFAKFFAIPMRNGIVRDIRNFIYAKILSLPLSYYSEEKKGDIISKISNDVKEVEWSVIKTIETSSREPFTIIFFFVTLIWMSPALTVFIIILLPLSGLIIGLVGRSLRKKSVKAQNSLGDLLSRVEETLSGLRIIKAFTAEKNVTQNFSDINNRYTKQVNRINKRQSLASPMSEFLGVFIMVIIMYYGGSMVLKNESGLSPSEFIGYIVIFSQIINPSKKLTTSFYDIRKGLASVDRINRILNINASIKQAKNPAVIRSFSDKIEFKNVSFKYTDEYILKNINLSIPKGKTIALVGQSGSGKSTLVDLLPRFYDIEEGEILIDGENIKKYDLKSLRSLMGNVNQDPILFNTSIAENIAFGAENAKIEQVAEAAKIANAHEFIMQTENAYDTNVGDRGSKLSGGQRQRISIARAVLSNPPVMILDEATSSLDTESEREVQEALTKLMKNRTSIVIAHRLSTIKNADEICVLHKGEIIERGTHSELMQKNGTYKKLHDLQMF